MMYGSAMVPQTGHWLLSAGPSRHATPVCDDLRIAPDSDTPVNSGSWALAIPRPENNVTQNVFLVMVMRDGLVANLLCVTSYGVAQTATQQKLGQRDFHNCKRAENVIWMT
jgi:hypothetical protein